MHGVVVDLDLDPFVRSLASAGATVPLRSVPKVLGLYPDDAAIVLDALIEAELAVIWDRPEEPAVALTPLGAARAGVELAGDPYDQEVSTWVGSGSRAKPIKQKRWMRGEKGAALATDVGSRAKRPGGQKWTLDSMRDPRPWDPTDFVKFDDEPSRYSDSSRATYDKKSSVRGPMIFVGLLRPWPIEPTPEGRCGGCGGNTLPKNWYCCVCDNFKSVDAMIAAARQKTELPKAVPVEDGLAGGVQRAKAKEPRVKAEKKPSKRKGFRMPKRNSFDLSRFR